MSLKLTFAFYSGIQLPKTNTETIFTECCRNGTGSSRWASEGGDQKISIGEVAGKLASLSIEPP